MVNELLLATNNEHKRREFVRLFPGVTILMPREVGFSFDFEENGTTFLANAQGKAMTLYERARRPVIADDSGLCVDGLGGEPGILSARYGSPPGGEPLGAPRRNSYLLWRMQGMKNRAAYFVCCLVVVLGEDRFVVAQETVHGSIADAPRGANGFGYDPLFLFPERGVTMAELSETEKDEISHRGRAARRIKALLAAGA
ncbi:MAG TPA: RdgB/HAM1 family non-canonical purine NTP pyrophosphatase [Spirochaetia bacterium]